MSSMVVQKKAKRPELGATLTYTALAVASSGVRQYEPLNHYDYSVLDRECSCDICQEWRAALYRFQSKQRQHLGRDNAFGTNMHPGYAPADVLDARSIYIAARERRDLYCECSWHSEKEPHGESFMEWLRGVLYDRKAHTDGWWESRAPDLPIAYWFLMFRRSATTSGAVLMASGFVTA